jgi:hypothetical protein
MNQNIYVMVSVPYVLLGVVGFLIYRGCRKNQEHLRAASPPDPSEPSPDSVE